MRFLWVHAPNRMWADVAWNLGGSFAPLLIAVPAAPVLVRALGNEKFGLLAIAWALIGYVGLFDFGLGRALTKVTAERLALGRRQGSPALLANCTVCMIVIGCPIAVLLVVLAGPISHFVTQRSALAGRDLFATMCIIGATVPFVTASSALRGYLDGHRAYAGQNLVRGATGMASYLCPALAALATTDLRVVIGALAMTRILAFLGYLYLCIRSCGRDVAFPDFRRGDIRYLARLGGWMTVSNVISPAMTYLDRFIIAALLPLASVAFYAAPYDMITKACIVSSSFATVLFPTFSTLVNQNAVQTRRTYKAAIAALAFILGPPLIMTAASAGMLMRLWMGPAFAAHSSRVLAILTIGVLINSIAVVPYALIQAAGRPDLTAKLHLLELPLYLITVFYATTAYGIVGTAVSWTARMSLDCILLLLISKSFIGSRTDTTARCA